MSCSLSWAPRDLTVAKEIYWNLNPTVSWSARPNQVHKVQIMSSSHPKHGMHTTRFEDLQLCNIVEAKLIVGGYTMPTHAGGHSQWTTPTGMGHFFFNFSQQQRLDATYSICNCLVATSIPRSHDRVNNERTTIIYSTMCYYYLLMVCKFLKPS